MGENEDVLVSVDRGVGLITLNRPKAINSLTHPMVTTLARVLTEWETDDDVTAVVVEGAGERGLCAGGDIVALYHSARHAPRISSCEHRQQVVGGHLPLEQGSRWTAG